MAVKPGLRIVCRLVALGLAQVGHVALACLLYRQNLVASTFAQVLKPLLRGLGCGVIALVVGQFGEVSQRLELLLAAGLIQIARYLGS